MVRDGYFYALALIAGAVLVGWFAQPAWSLVPLLLAGFFLLALQGISEIIKRIAALEGLAKVDAKYERPLQ